MYSSSSSSLDMEEGIAFVSPVSAGAVAQESPPSVPSALAVVTRSPLCHQEEAATTATAGGDHDSSSTDQHGANSSHAVAKGKRPRALAPSSAQQPTSASSASNSYLSGGSGAITEEEEDMANCLIMLAQSDPHGASGNNSMIKHQERAPGSGRATSRKFAETSVTASGCASAKAGFYVYECKTCSRCFSTFQALGGHRASHKKPKVESSCYGVAGHDHILDSEEKTRPLEQVMINRPQSQEQQRLVLMESRIAPTTVPPSAAATTNTSVVHHTTQNNTNVNSSSSINVKSTTTRIHECSICGSEFQSGQALGGHMRRHRAAAAAAAPTSTASASLLSQVLQVPKKSEAKAIVLDLNLPAPSEDADVFPKPTPVAPTAPTFPFSVPSKRPPMLFSSSPLVDCHY